MKPETQAARTAESRFSALRWVTSLVVVNSQKRFLDRQLSWCTMGTNRTWSQLPGDCMGILRPQFTAQKKILRGHMSLYEFLKPKSVAWFSMDFQPGLKSPTRWCTADRFRLHPMGAQLQLAPRRSSVLCVRFAIRIFLTQRFRRSCKTPILLA